MKISVFLIVLLAVSILSVLQAEVQNVVSVKGKDDFEFFLMSMTWPGSFCQQGKSGCYVPPTTEGFTIHGLWPTNFNSKSYPEFCRPDMPFDASKIQDLLGDLRHYWTDFLHKEPEFWEHEFDKHGQCSIGYSGIGDEHAYFVQALKLAKSFNPLAILRRNGIEPNKTHKYKVSLVQETIEKTIGFKPQIQCRDGQISEMRFCLSKNDIFQFIDCRTYGTNCPGGEMIFTPLPTAL